MKLGLIALICALLQSTIALAEHTSNNGVSSIFHDEQRTFHCERYKKILEFMGDRSAAEIEEQLQAEIAGHSILMKSSELSFKERKLFYQQIRVLKKILSYQDKKQGLKTFQEGLCKGSQAVTGVLAVGTAWMANIITSVALAPFHAIGKLTKGLITGKVKEGESEIYYDIIGPTLYDGTTGNLLFSKRYLGLAMSHPWLFPIIAAPAIDNEVMIICKRKHSLRKAETAFCNNYIGFKKKMLIISRPFEIAGASVHKVLSQKDDQLQDTAPYTQEEIIKDLTEMTEENFCSQMVAIGAKYKKSKSEIKANANRETWRLGLNPERYGMPDIVDFETVKDNLVRPAGKNNLGKLRNIVVSLGPAQWQTENLDTKELYSAYKKNYKEFKSYVKKGREIFQGSDTVEKCEELKKRQKFNYKEFESISKAVHDDELGKKLYESKNVKNYFKREASIFNLFNGTKLKWEFVDSGDIETIHQILNSKDVGNVILVIHGTKKGKIIDSNSNEIPRNFFDHISPSIMSLNFFSCYSQKIDEFYGISKALSSSKSYNATRHLSFVEVDESYSYTQGQVPLQAFTGYLDKLDHFLAHTVKGNYLYQSVAHDLPANTDGGKCELHIENLGQKQGTYSVNVNNVYVGTITSPREKTHMLFDCGVLKAHGNKLRMVDINLRYDESLTLKDAQIHLIHPDYSKFIGTDELTVIEVEGNVLGITGQFDL